MSEVVGKHWGGYSSKLDRVAIFFCVNYDPEEGYWMHNIHDPADHVCVGDRAPWGTFWPAEDRGSYWYIPQWRVGIGKRDGQRHEDTQENYGTRPQAQAVH